METKNKEGLYIYCLITSGESKTFGSLGIGARGDQLYTIGADGIAAVVSNTPIVEYPTSRANLIAHERAIEEVMKEYTVLPVRFGTIAEDEKQVRRILETQVPKFREMVEKLEGKKEVGIKAIFKKEVIYDYVLDKYEEIRKLKERINGLPAQKSHYQRIEIGRMVEKALETEKEQNEKQIFDSLSPLTIEAKSNKLFGALMVINTAFLIAKSREEEFDRQVNELDTRLGERVSFKYVSQVPPFNFVNLSIKT
ncbi:MAG: GvpL/GvpF family gas vesicle protein [Candidatus Omnitrophica bacterium]|nr:GvpL/GvpF family gas vesicle protein [Candidatus Omnitrophota bacterium]